MYKANDAGGRNLAGQRVPRDAIDVMSVKTEAPLRERGAKVKVWAGGGKRMLGCYHLSMNMHADVRELAAAIRELEAHLRKHRVTNWPDGLAQSAQLIELGEAHGLYLFQRSFGGMGSLNDVILDSEMDQLDQLRAKAWALAQHLDRSLLRI